MPMRLKRSVSQYSPWRRGVRFATSSMPPRTPSTPVDEEEPLEEERPRAALVHAERGAPGAVDEERRDEAGP